MDKNQVKAFLKCILCGLVWTTILIFIGLVLLNYRDYNLKDVLFIEGIILVILSILSSISGNPMGLSLQALGQTNAQYVSNSNLQILKIEKTKTTLKPTLSTSLSMTSLAIGGGICTIISFII